MTDGTLQRNESGRESAPEPTNDEGQTAADERSDPVTVTGQRPGDETTTNGDASSSLAGEALELGYPSTEDPIVELERIDLPAGEVTALVGPNGSGKSTLLKALARQLQPDAGTVALDGSDVATFESKQFAKRVGLLSQENESPGSLTAEELIYHGRYPHRGFLEGIDETDRRAVERAIDLAGVEHLREEPIGNLSGGQKQLVWVAMVLAQDTDVLLLDEPTTFLDLHHQLRVMEVIETLNEERGVTVGVVLHDIAQAARYADNLVALRDGGVYDWGPPDEVVTEDLLEEVFGVIATVGYGEEGPTIQPHHPVEE